MRDNSHLQPRQPLPELEDMLQYEGNSRSGMEGDGIHQITHGNTPSTPNTSNTKNNNSNNNNNNNNNNNRAWQVHQ